MFLLFVIEYFVLLSFHPFSNVHPDQFNSDTAIPVIMARDGYVSPYSLFYYGQDRWGSWPILASSVFAKLLHVPADVVFIYYIGFSLLLVSLIVFAFSIRTNMLWLLSVFPGVFLLKMAVPFESPFLQMTQPYAWMLSCLLLFISINARLLSSHPSRLSRTQTSVYFVASSVLCSLGIWVSRSAVFFFASVLLFFTLAGSVRGRVTGERIPRQFLTATLSQFLAVIVGVIVESQVRHYFLSYSLQTYGTRYDTLVSLDREHFAANWNAVRVQFFGYWTIGIILITGMEIMYLIGRYRATRDAGETSTLVHVATSLALLSSGLLNVGLCIGVTYIRLNAYHHRYFVPSYVFCVLACAVASASCVQGIGDRGFRRRVSDVVLVALAILSAIRLNVNEGEESRELRRQAALLEEFYGGKPILGTYWGTYVFAGLQHGKPLIPVPTEGEVLRTPWTPRALGDADEILVSHRQTNQFGGSLAPLLRIKQHTYEFELVRAEAVVGAHTPVSLYRRLR